MRTVTFSDPLVMKRLNEKFVCAWVNKKPEVKFKDPERHWRPQRDITPNGAGATNVNSIFAAADGTVIHAMPGMLSREFFIFHMDLALDLHARMYAPGVTAEQRAQICTRAHAEYFDQNTHRSLDLIAHNLLRTRVHDVDSYPLTIIEEPKMTKCGGLGTRAIIKKPKPQPMPAKVRKNAELGEDCD